MNDGSRRERLGALARGRGVGLPGSRVRATAGPPPRAAGGGRPGDLSARIPGVEASNASGRHWRIERPIPVAADVGASLRAVRRDSPHGAEVAALVAAEGSAATSVLFLDLETCGFAGTPLFLAGLLVWRPGEAQLVQLLARDYAEEASVVRGALDEVSRHSLLVTFNGKSYDVPFLADRARMHGMEAALPPGHLDLLHAARRRWKDVLPDCRLQTLEARFTGRRRAGDVPGSEVPERYHAFVRTGDPRGLVPVLRHNLMDLLTLAEILAAVAGSSDSPG